MPVHLKIVPGHIQNIQIKGVVIWVYSQTSRGAHTHIVASVIKQTLANNVKLGNKEQPFINKAGL